MYATITLRPSKGEWWSDPYLGGAIIVVPLAGYLIWRRREEVGKAPPRGRGWGWLLLVFAAALHWLGVWIGAPHPSALSLVPLAWGVTILGWGVAGARQLAGPLALLVFITPLPVMLDRLTFPLRLLSTRLAATLPQLLKIPCQVEGTSLHLSNFSLAVDIPCSGLRSIWSLLFAAVLLADFQGIRGWCIPLLLGLTIPLGMFDNVLRIELSVLLGNLFGGAVAERFFHSLAGFVCFALSLWLLILSAEGLRKWPPQNVISR